ncbi:hypothetical protein CRG98_003445 [Punica granatum]|uniref:Uncharacterized protein n=1 Tax=Punica granatum TaxID=22663 RepID=A0A2I0L5W1_PUNGR|nr:hypothetical protein CRG98_003445 [Punica granatum]
MDKEKTVDPQSPPPPWSDHECSSDIEYLMDSDGEKYEVYSDGTHDMTSKEWDECCRRVEEESEDYDVQVFPIVANFGIIQPMALDEKQLPKFIRAAAVTLDKYKKDKVSCYDPASFFQFLSSFNNFDQEFTGAYALARAHTSMAYGRIILVLVPIGNRSVSFLTSEAQKLARDKPWPPLCK